MRRGLSARMLAASVLLALVVCGAFALLLVSIDSLRDSARLARHSQEVLAAANRLERLVIDLQTGPRGYAITHSERFLEPWQQARRRYPAATRELEELIADNPAQAEQARRIGRAIASYYAQYSLPLVELTRRSQDEGRAVIAKGEGKRRVDAIRAQFATFASVQQNLSDRRRDEANADGRRAIGVGIGGVLASLLLVIGFAFYLARVVVVPVRRVAGAAGRLAGGDLSARVGDRAPGELGELASSFNAMAASLEESRDELESQNAELELQTAELEDQQARLEAANDELQAQQAELSRAVEQLDEEKQRVETFYAFAKQIATDADVDTLAPTILAQLCEAGGAESGLLYVLDEQQDGARFVPLAAVGFDRARLPDVVAGEGLAGRVLLEHRSIVADHGATGLKLRAFGEDVSVGAELHVPLVQGERVLGVVTLARLTARPFPGDDRQLLEHLAAQAAVALANAIAFRAAVRQASINRAVLNSTTDAIAMVDAEGRTVVANRATTAVAESHGLTPGGGLFAAAAAIRERVTDPQAYAASIERLVTDAEAEFEFEYELKSSGRSFKTYTAPVLSDDAAPIGRILVIRETTAEREAERLKSELVATVSHELRTPLASILGFTELMVQRDVDPAKRSRYLQTIHGEAQRLTALINDFLDLQRIEAGRLLLSPQPFELGLLLDEQLALFLAQSAAHRLGLDLPPAPLHVYADRERTTQVIANLLSNAIKYSPAGGEVRVAAAERNGAIRVEVRDQGVGIPPEQQSRIFTKFFRVDSSDTREIGGTGLGLALAQEIVAAQGGRIGFDSVPGEGSTFWFELPSAERRNGDGALALVVEDDAATASLLVEYVGLEGLRSRVVASGEEALEVAAEEQPLVICLDIGLAGELDGWQVLAQLKASNATAHVPVVVCSARNGREDAAALGAADFLTKPFSSRELRSTLHRVLPARAGRVLVVDDEPAVRELVAASLSGDGLELDEAADGEEALACVARRRPDAIVLDLMMPRLDGFAVLERLQADPETRDVPVVVLTARRLGAHERERLSARAHALLEKSAYSGEELRRLIRRALGRTS